MSGICDTCRYKSCPRKGEGLIICDFYIRVESNYEKLFGTPERAARTACDMHECGLGMPIECDDCAAMPICASGAKDYDALLEWLRGDAE